MLEITDELGDCDEYSDEVAEAALAKASLVATGHDDDDDHDHAHIHWWLWVMIIILCLIIVVIIGWYMYKRRQNDKNDSEAADKNIIVGVANPVYSDAK